MIRHSFPSFHNNYVSRSNSLAPGGLSAEYFQASVMQISDPEGLRSYKCSKVVFGYVTVVIGTHLILVVFNNSEV